MRSVDGSLRWMKRLGRRSTEREQIGCHCLFPALCPTALRGDPATVISPEANTDGNRADQLAKLWRVTMKTLVSALVALTFVAGVFGPAIAAEPFSIKTLDQDNRGGHNYSGSVIEQLDKEGRGGHAT